MGLAVTEELRDNACPGDMDPIPASSRPTLQKKIEGRLAEQRAAGDGQGRADRIGFQESVGADGEDRDTDNCSAVANCAVRCGDGDRDARER